MKSTIYFFFVGVIFCILPITANGIEDGNDGGGGPKAQQSNISIVSVETSTNVINLTFMLNLGEVQIRLTDLSGNSVLQDAMDTAVQTQGSFFAPAGTYILTVTNADGLMLLGTTIVIP